MESTLYQNEEPLSVSEAMARAKHALESFSVKIIGEVSEVNNKPGYKAVYFTIKDAQASLPCMMWLNRYQPTGVDLRVGMLVELTGRFTLYAPKGRMNFDVIGLSLAGEGDLRLRVANLAKKLQAEGLMNPARKRPIPSYPQAIGLVTSPRGAAVHDVLRTLRRRFPLAKVIIAGVAVEGERAVSGLISALSALQNTEAEVILLVRGGGSFEDLMPFNDEILARAVVSSKIPVVTGIGHEPDTSIVDMVADLRASTPTAAAEAVSPSPEVLEGVFASRTRGLQTALSRKIERQILILDRIAEHPLFKDSNMLYATEAQMLDLAEEHLHRVIPLNIERDKVKLQRNKDRLRACGSSLLMPFETALSLNASRLHDLSPLIVLSRGYALVKDTEGALVKSIHSVEKGDSIEIEIADGTLACSVEEIEETAVVDWEELHD